MYYVGGPVQIKSVEEFAEYGYCSKHSEAYRSFITPSGLSIFNVMVSDYNSRSAVIKETHDYGDGRIYYRLDIDDGYYLWDEYCLSDFEEFPDLTGIEELI